MSKIFVDQIPPAGGRKYTIVAGTDGTVQINDVTVYEQEGTPWGAADATAAMKAVDDVAAAGTNITVLQNASAPKTTAGTAPNFTVDDTTVTAYESGLRRTIVAHADSGINPTLNFNSKGAKSVFQSTGKAASWKAGQHVVVEYDGTNFFVCSAGGGVEFPSAPSAGDTVIFAVSETGTMASSASSYTDMGYVFTANNAGTYRFKYNVRITAAATAYARLTKNSSEVSGSAINTTSQTYGTSKVIDVACNAGDIVKFQMYRASSGFALTDALIVSILAADVQAEINNMLTVATV